ncbi:MAG: neutral zinc metallopeptidase [Actinobacteria bacterium]|nr:neutral zinc metallopeptidase [Actinomycetota bacterium]
MRRVAVLVALAMAAAACSAEGSVLAGPGSSARGGTGSAAEATDPPAASTTTTTVPPAPATLRETTDLTIAAVEAFWESELPEAYGVAYRTVSATVPYLPSSGDLPECGPEELPPGLYEDNAFYCHPGDFVAWDAEGLMPGLYTEFGDFAVSLVLAHEWGHVVQARVGVEGPGIMLELQADCFAGAWAADVDGGGSEVLALRPGDLDEAVAGYLLFRDPPGTSPGAPDAHGSAFDRVNAFQEGFFGGAATCAGYPGGGFSVVDIPLTQQDLVTGGDLPFAQTAPLLAATLEAYWTSAYPAVFGGDYAPIGGFGPYYPSTGDLPACDGLGPGDYAGNAFYCPDGDYVAWDDEGLFPALWQEIGDLAVGMVLAHEWAAGVQARAGLPSTGLAASLQADCLAGSWTRAMAAGIPITVDGGEQTIVLSAGDLDEAVAGFLAFGGPELSRESGTAFERFDAFQDGFFGGAAACLAYSG